MQSFHQFSRPKEGGLIRHYDLADWWAEEFDDHEQMTIERICDSDGEMMLAQGRIWESSGDAVKLLNGLYSDLAAANEGSLALRVVLKSYALARSDTDLMDLHNTCQHVIEAYEGQSSGEEDAAEKLLDASETQIGIALDVAQLLAKTGHRSLPQHQGYKTLVRIREEENYLSEAIRIAEQAKTRGWQGDWDKIAKRCRKQANKKPGRKFLFEIRKAKVQPETTEEQTSWVNEAYTPAYNDEPAGMDPIEDSVPVEDAQPQESKTPPPAPPPVSVPIIRRSIFRDPLVIEAAVKTESSPTATPVHTETLAGVSDNLREREVTIRQLEANLRASREELRSTARAKEQLSEKCECFEKSEREALASLSLAEDRVGDLESRLLEEEERLALADVRADDEKALADTFRQDLELAKNREASSKASFELLEIRVSELQEDRRATEETLNDKVALVEVLERDLKSREARTVDLSGALARLDGEADRLRLDLEESGKQRDALAAELEATREKALQQAQQEARNLRRILREREHASILSPDWDYDPYSPAFSDDQEHVLHACSSCKRSLEIPAEFVGWYGKCKFCGSDIHVSGDEGSP